MIALLMGLKSVSPAELDRLVREGKVRVLSAGISGWVAAGLPTEAG